MNTKTISIVIILVALIIGGIILFSGGAETKNGASAQNVSVADGKQIIEITVKGGYLPRTMTARANMPTVIRFKTNGTFDCSSAVSIPALGYRANLPSSGETLVEVSSQKRGNGAQRIMRDGDV